MKQGILLFALAALMLLANAPAGRTGGDKANPILELAKEKVADPKKPFTMVVLLTVKNDQGKLLEEAFRPAIKASRKEAGCLAYELNRDPADANRYFVYERWKSISALEYHMGTEHFKTLLSKASDVLAKAPEPKFFVIVGE